MIGLNFGFLKGLFGKGKPGDSPSKGTGAVATPALLTMLTRASTIQPSWTEDVVALAKYHRARYKRRRTSQASRVANRGRHPMSAHAA